MKDAILISGYSSDVPRKIEKIKEQYLSVSSGAVFFENANFLITNIEYSNRED